MDPLVAAIDQGTSSTRFLVSDVVDDGDGLYYLFCFLLNVLFGICVFRRKVFSGNIVIIRLFFHVAQTDFFLFTNH